MNGIFGIINIKENLLANNLLKINNYYPDNNNQKSDIDKIKIIINESMPKSKDLYFEQEDKFIFGASRMSEKTTIFKKNSKSFLLLLVGSILNIDEFEKDADYFEEIFKKNGMSLINMFKGAFTGLILDKNSNTFYFFTDQISSKTLYYSYEKDIIIFGNELKFVSYIRNILNLGNLPNYNAFYSMLSIGHMIHNETYIKNVYKLLAGEYIEISLLNSTYNKSKYFKISNNPILKDKSDDIINNIIKLYDETIDLMFKYDEKFTKNHLIFLSGGLDSRLLTGTAKKLSYNNCTCLNFAQSFCQDNESAQLIAEKLQYDFIFTSLNHGNYLLNNIDDIIYANDGLIPFSGASHVFNSINKINLNHYGLANNGMIIEYIFGRFCENYEKEKWFNSIINVKNLGSKLENLDNYLNSYSNYEEFMLFNRGLNAISNGLRMIEFFSEFNYPLMNYELVDYSFKMPYNLKYRNGLKEYVRYKIIYDNFPNLRWILNHNNLSPVFPFNFPTPIFHLLNNIKRVILNRPYFSQNPFNIWLKQNPNILFSFDKLFYEDLDYVSNTEFKDDITNLYKSSKNLSIKTRCITAIKAAKLHKIKL